jgi:hypothetical protein
MRNGFRPGPCECGVAKHSVKEASASMGNGHGPTWVRIVFGLPAAIMAWYLIIRTPKSLKQILVGAAMVGYMAAYYWFFFG